MGASRRLVWSLYERGAMLKGVVVCLVVVIAPTARAQPNDDTSLFEQGQPLYAEHCALCHGHTGAGDPPTFPALGGNDQLSDTARIVGNVNQGTDRMPPFPQLTPTEIASVMTYVRNAWDNAFGDVTIQEVATMLEDLGENGDTVPVWAGVFTEIQATRGQAVYGGACGLCHGRRLNSAPDDPDMPSTPPLARARFIREWDGRSLASLFEYIRATMPEGNPQSLTDQEYIDVITYMLTVDGMPAGDNELPTDPQRLAHIVFQPRP